MNRMFLIKGLPGSGKSTFARTLAHETGAWHFEADMYFDRNGEYEFDASKLPIAHAWCYNSVFEEVMAGMDVVVSNTFTRERELKPYLDLAEQAGYQVTVLIVESRHGNGSLHNVPEETMERMRQRFSVKL